jgi:large subunit ribosomal protein L25
MLTLNAEKREIFGNRLGRERVKGRLPVVVYGGKKETESFFVGMSEFKKIWDSAGESTIISLKTPGGDRDVLIHDSAFHPVTGLPLHADFYVIDSSKPIQIKVPLVFEGVSPAVKNLGAVLVKVLHELEIEVLPKNLPRNLSVDLSVLAEINSHVSVKNITLPESARALAKPDDIIVSAAPPKEEEIEEVVAPVDLSSIEVEKKGKEETAEGATTEQKTEEKDK